MKLLTEALLSTNIWTSVLLVIDDIVTKKVKGNSLPICLLSVLPTTNKNSSKFILLFSYQTKLLTTTRS